MILDYYSKYKQFCGPTGEELRERITELENRGDEYETERNERFSHFAISLKVTSLAYYVY